MKKVIIITLIVLVFVSLAAHPKLPISGSLRHILYSTHKQPLLCQYSTQHSWRSTDTSNIA
jgi:hypothetical protein